MENIKEILIVVQVLENQIINLMACTDYESAESFISVYSLENKLGGTFRVEVLRIW